MHLMIDIETLGTGPDAPVMEIGAIKFDRNNVYDSFGTDVLPDFTHQVPDVSTIAFWNRQKIKMPLNENAPDFPAAVFSLVEWLGQSPMEGVWANAPSFDLVILQQSARSHGFNMPWSHSQFRDCRTMFAIGKRVNVPRVRSEILHSAVEDARAQALSIIAINTRLKGVVL